MRISLRLYAFSVTMLFAVSCWAQGTAPPMAKMCEKCHGPGGVSVTETVPTIAGISEWVQEDSMHAYKEGARNCTMEGSEMMCSMMQKLSHDQIEELGQYFSTQTFVPAAQAFDEAKAGTGQALHEEHCAKCHTGSGSVAEDDASILAGQWMPYLQAQLGQFASGEREGLKPMIAKVEKLSPDELDALVHYYASQQ